MGKSNRPRFNDSPCHNCKDRHEACHATCEKYAAYQKETRVKPVIDVYDDYVRKSYKSKKSKWRPV